MGHKANSCPVRREEYKRKHKRQHAHIVEDEEPPMKMNKDHVLDLGPLRICITWRGHMAH